MRTINGSTPSDPLRVGLIDVPGGSHPSPLIANDTVYPVSFAPGTPGRGSAAYLAEPAVQRHAEFFERKGLAALKEEDRHEAWYDDWIEYQAKHGLYACVMSPKAYSTRGCELDLLKLTRFWEASAYFSPAHAYRDRKSVV